MGTFKMPAQLKVYYRQELMKAENLFRQGDLPASWAALERSHILGQPYAVEHSWSHWLMLKFGFRTKNLKEILGQMPRLLVGGVKSFVGVIPVGNTGGANVPPLRAMPVPDDLRKKMIIK